MRQDISFSLQINLSAADNLSIDVRGIDADVAIEPSPTAGCDAFQILLHLDTLTKISALVAGLLHKAANCLR
jgi:hypothetical protein